MLDLSFSITDLEFFLLILTRISSFVFVAPFFSMDGTPRNIKVGFSVLFSVLLYNILPKPEIVYGTVLGFGLIVVKEALTGLIIGYSASIVRYILAMAGHISDMESGLSMATLFDPATRENITITGAYYNYGVTLMLFISGMYQFLLAALKESYVLIPVNGAVFSTEKLLSSIVIFLGDYLMLGFRICLPIFSTMLVLNAVLGILAKVSPQMNMFAVGMQLKVLTGLGILFVTVAMMPSISTMLMDEMRKMVTLFVESML
ncbi:MAG: flagellar biosynthetic protein FliR [Lachnospiraceae bacterium]|nr:flagellar biosynthetic protein FliR [Lachnospiraceae bacterium]